MAKLPPPVTNQQLMDALAEYPPDAPVWFYLNAGTNPHWWVPNMISTDGQGIALGVTLKPE